MYVTQQDYLVRTVRAAAILTNAYVAGTVLGAATVTSDQVRTNDQIDEFNHLALECDFTIGSLTNAGIMIEFSDDNSTFYQLATGTVSGGNDAQSFVIIQLTATGKYYIHVNKEYFSGESFKTKYIRISSIGVGTVTSSSLTITAVLWTS